MVHQDKVNGLTVMSIGMRVGVTMDGLVAEECVGDDEIVALTEVKEADAQ